MRRRVGAAAAGLSILLAGALLPGVQPTTASFVDDEYASTAISTITLAPPQSISIINCTGLLGTGIGAGVTIEWQFPAGAPYAGFTPAANVQWAFNSAGDNWQAVATQAQGNGRYRTTFNTGIISGLLSLLLGGEMTFQSRTVLGNWNSGSSAKVKYTAPVLGSPSCQIVP
ncbi:hypothetical protein ACWIBQ_01400 [Microbacterium keratanolyticum]